MISYNMVLIGQIYKEVNKSFVLLLNTWSEADCIYTLGIT